MWAPIIRLLEKKKKKSSPKKIELNLLLLPLKLTHHGCLHSFFFFFFWRNVFTLLNTLKLKMLNSFNNKLYYWVLKKNDMSQKNIWFWIIFAYIFSTWSTIFVFRGIYYINFDLSFFDRNNNMSQKKMNSQKNMNILLITPSGFYL